MTMMLLLAGRRSDNWLYNPLLDGGERERENILNDSDKIIIIQKSSVSIQFQECFINLQRNTVTYYYTVSLAKATLIK